MIDSSRDVVQKIVKGMLSRYPLIYLVGREEERIEKILSRIISSETGGEEGHELISWSVASGFSDTGECQEPMQAIERIRQSDTPQIFLLKDFPAFLVQNPRLTRAMRDLYYRLKGTKTFVMLTHPTLKIPDELNKEIYLVEMGLPTGNEIDHYLDLHYRNQEQGSRLDSAALKKLASAMVGLTLDEIGHLLNRLARMKGFDLQAALDEVHDEKAQALKKESCLEFIPPRYSLEQIGGLNNLKQWVLKRRELFTETAMNAGVPLPSGLLLMGVSGCGKSMAAKTIAAAWDLPLVRLDMSLVLSGSYGAPESAFRHATRVAEEIAPVVLWIDELENSFGYDETAPGSGNINIFSSFLTWMQDKPSNVFLAATANRIQLLPAELIRKGRFDQLFFLDLPTKEERIEIFRIHIQLQGGNPEQFELGYLATLTKEWSGAEIEQAIISARVDAYQESREFTEADISRNTSQMVPLAQTMREQIKAIKDWSYNRAVSAS
jgi:SpoVK/Ycf46/Vps4 family AAA+-type ATPase